MSRQTCIRRALAVAFAAAVILAGPAHAQHVGNSMVDGACLYMKKKDVKVDPGLNAEESVPGGIGSWVKAGWSAVTDWMDGKSPLCQIDKPAGVLLATAEFIDRAALNAAKGIASIEKAMGEKETLTTVIVELEQALAGEQPTAQIDETRVRASEQIGARAKEIESELARRESPFLGSEALEAHVTESQVALQSSMYYQAQSGLGVATFKDFWESSSDQERKAMLVANKEVGITSEFAHSLPSRGAAMLKNVVNATRLGLSINKTLDARAVKRARRAIREAREQEADTAMQIARDINARTSSGFALAGDDSSGGTAPESAPATGGAPAEAPANAADDESAATIAPATSVAPATDTAPAALSAAQPKSRPRPDTEAAEASADCAEEPPEERKGLFGRVRSIGEATANVIRAGTECENDR